MNKLTKIDLGMLDAADTIHRDLVNGVSDNIYSHQIEYDGTGMAQPLRQSHPLILIMLNGWSVK